jgi:uncharacterized membrane protein
VSAPWGAIAVVAVANVLMKASGPLVLGERELGPRARAVTSLLAPALLAALIVVETVGDDGRLVLDARIVGVGVVGAALAMRAPMLPAVGLGAAATALLRALT